MKFSIIIPAKSRSAYLDECLRHCASLKADYEILVLTDRNAGIRQKKVRAFATGSVGPAEKRDIGIRHATGVICAFIDDDTYPSEDWLENAEKYFADERIAAIGGPAVTPQADSLLQRAGGAVYASLLGGGAQTYRYAPKKRRYVDDYPSCNLLVRTSVLRKLGGFDTHYYPGEDTKLCLDIVRTGKRILYAPDVLIYHHRRSLFIPHLRQVWNYGVHRGFFAKKFPATSLRASYFIPTFFTAGVFTGTALSAFSASIAAYFFAMLLTYFLLAFASALAASKSIPIAILATGGIFLTHIAYGIAFVKGILSKRLSR
jgi:GT2 family glycosyltransferase